MNEIEQLRATLNRLERQAQDDQLKLFKMQIEAEGLQAELKKCEVHVSQSRFYCCHA